jgi:hypothetical protein
VLGDIFGVPIFGQVLVGIVVASIVYVADRLGRVVASAVDREVEDAERERQTQRSLAVWAFGAPAVNGYAEVPSFVKQTWPEYEKRFTRVEAAVVDQLEHNGGGSMADHVDRLPGIERLVRQVADHLGISTDGL